MCSCFRIPLAVKIRYKLCIRSVGSIPALREWLMADRYGRS